MLNLSDYMCRMGRVCARTTRGRSRSLETPFPTIFHLWVPSGIGSEDLLSVVTDLRQKCVIHYFLMGGFGIETLPKLDGIIGVASLDLVAPIGVLSS